MKSDLARIVFEGMLGVDTYNKIYAELTKTKVLGEKNAYRCRVKRKEGGKK